MGRGRSRLWRRPASPFPSPPRASASGRGRLSLRVWDEVSASFSGVRGALGEGRVQVVIIRESRLERRHGSELGSLVDQQHPELFVVSRPHEGGDLSRVRPVALLSHLAAVPTLSPPPAHPAGPPIHFVVVIVVVAAAVVVVVVVVFIGIALLG